MNFAGRYFSKYKYASEQIKEPPSGLLRFVVVIPAYLEDKACNTLKTLKYADNPQGDVEVIVVINHGEHDSEENKKKNLGTYKDLTGWCAKNSGEGKRFFTLLARDLPKKHAGVGLARKIGMDEALARFGVTDRSDGIILSLDADAKVDRHYFTSAERIGGSDRKYEGFIYQFAHELEGKEYSREIYDAIAGYELHLRYYKHILDYSGFPYSNYTIGSCFGVKAGLYARQGGMNRRQGGEDFYFLNKLFPNAEFACITDSCITLSPRPSERVPFGTGPAITKMSENGAETCKTYSPQAFFDLKKVFDSVERLYRINENSPGEYVSSLPESVKEFLLSRQFEMKFKEIKGNTSSPASFTKRFYSWFDGFMVVKFLNDSHNKYFDKIPVNQAVAVFLRKIGLSPENNRIRSLLELFRKLDREGRDL